MPVTTSLDNTTIVMAYIYNAYQEGGEWSAAVAYEDTADWDKLFFIAIHGIATIIREGEQNKLLECINCYSQNIANIRRSG